MRITYYALRPLQVGDTLREPGDLVPEAADWAFLAGYLREGRLAPVLVATLPQKSQEVLAAWEKDQQGEQAENSPVAPPQASTTGEGKSASATSSKREKEKV